MQAQWRHKCSSELLEVLLPCAVITDAWRCNLGTDVGAVPQDASPGGPLEGAAGTARLLPPAHEPLKQPHGISQLASSAKQSKRA